jgi:hypothetical protein
MRKPVLALATVLGLAAATPAFAHCDSLDGPVVSAARTALDSGDPAPVLIWVRPADEAEVRAAFHQSREVRRLGPQARELADRAFFETLVRVHRAGEGAPYTGLKPAGYDFGPAVAAADAAVASGDESKVSALLTQAVSEGLHARFETLQRQRRFDPKDLRAGREYVESYVTFVHYVEGIHEAAEAAGAHHAETTADAH